MKYQESHPNPDPYMAIIERHEYFRVAENDLLASTVDKIVPWMVAHLSRSDEQHAANPFMKLPVATDYPRYQIEFSHTAFNVEDRHDFLDDLGFPEEGLLSVDCLCPYRTSADEWSYPEPEGTAGLPGQRFLGELAITATGPIVRYEDKDYQGYYGLSISQIDPQSTNYFGWTSLMPSGKGDRRMPLRLNQALALQKLAERLPELYANN